jgi:protein-S-isoprenylcysteine O-methyltransferase Ste14
METPLSHAFEKTKLYDVAIAAPLMGLCLYQAGLYSTSIAVEIQFVLRAGLPSAAFAVGVAGQFAVVLFLMLQFSLLIIRSMPKQKSVGIIPRAVALMGTLTTVATPLLPRAEISETVAMISIILVFVGSAGAAYSLSWLGRSFSILPEARALVVRGPYRLIRHPLYAFEIVSMLGIILQFKQPYALLQAALLIALQMTRMHYEERVLTATFSSYAPYAQKTARLIPGVY